MSERSPYRWEVVQTVAAERVIAVIRRASAEEAIDHGLALVEAGLRIIEVSFTTPDAQHAIAELAALAPTGTVVGAGTVLDATSARLAILAGARLIVAPNLDAEVVTTAHRYGVAVVPGVADATDALRAMELGADLVKLFPASAVGVKGLQAMLEALPDVPFVPTGGVAIDDAAAWIDAGAVAVGMGSSLTADRGRELVDRLAGRA